LSELSRFSLLRKRDVLDTDRVVRDRFHFDFISMLETKFAVDPLDYARPAGMDIELLHTEQQKALIAGYVAQYTTSLIGLGRILLRANMNRLYRRARPADGKGSTLSALTAHEPTSADGHRLVI
jgi:hypothetical protein